MPLYSMFCMAKPAIGRAAIGSMMRLAGNTVLDKGGVLTDIVSFGRQDLAYDIRNQGVKYGQAEVFQMDFMVEPAALEDLEHNLKVDERMLRYVLQKKDPLPRLPTTYKVSKLARALRERGALPVRCDVLTSAEPIQQAPACSVSEVLGSLQGKAGI